MRAEDRAAAQRCRPAPSFPTTRRKSTWPAWRRCARACAAAITTKWCCARPSARPTPARPPSCSERVQHASPSPYEFLLQFGDEQLVGASPEMFVRVEGQRVETCPISGTAQRTGDPLRDAENIRELLESTKEESELTMCTDVDRNDKSRVCEPGTVQGDRAPADRILRRRVPHRGPRGGPLKEGFDSLDAFLSHMWAVTMIGAPKKAAAQAIEASGEERARLVRRRRRHDLAQRRHQHRHPDPHHLSARRHGLLSRWARRCSTIPSRRWKSAKRASRPPAFSARWARAKPPRAGGRREPRAAWAPA